MVEVEPGRAERCIHLEGEVSYLEAEGKETNWKETYSRIMQLAKEELVESTPGKYLEKESWWWNDAVQQAVTEKRRLFREWHKTR